VSRIERCSSYLLEGNLWRPIELGNY